MPVPSEAPGEGLPNTLDETSPTMAKWVALLLLLLAILSFGLSKMRPVPQEQPGAESTPVEVSSVQVTPEPSDVEPVSVEPVSAEPVGPAGNPTQPSRPKGTTKGPKFAHQTTVGKDSPKPGVSKPGKKVDPFSSKKVRPKRPVFGKIKATILSDSPEGGARTKFRDSTKSVYLTATPQGLKDRVEVVAQYRSVLDSKAPFSSPVISSGPPRRRVFRLDAPPEGWKAGPYQVTLTVKDSDQVLGLERFEILSPKENLAQEMPQPEYMDLVPDMEAEVNKTSYTDDDKEILLRVSAQKLKSGTIIRSVWSAVEVDKLTSGELIAVSTQAAPGPGQDTIFSFEAPPGGFHTGSYKVDLYFDQQPVGGQTFFVEPAPKPSPSP